MAERKPASLVIYTAEAQIDDATKAAMIEAGYLPIQVANVDAVKIIAPQIPDAHMNAVFQAAMQALSAYDSGPSQFFGNRLAKALSGKSS